MGDIFHSMVEGSKKIGEFLGYESAGITPASDSTKRAKRLAWQSMQPKPVPTIDQATQAQLESDRLLRRRGALGNVYGGATTGSAQGPSVGLKTLLGE